MGTFDFSRADLMATAPSLGAGTVRKAPLNFPVGVRDPLMMYASWISCLAALDVLKCLETCARRWLEAFIWDVAMRTDMMVRVQRGQGKEESSRSRQ
jgi:hypothetical protein